MISLSEARDLGQGFIQQTAADGNACYSEVYAVVMDCNTGRAMVVGPHIFDLMAMLESPDRMPPLEKVMKDLYDASQNGEPMTLSQLDDASAKAGLTTRLSLRTRDRIDLNGRRIPLDCACKTFYPGLKPAN